MWGDGQGAASSVVLAGLALSAMCGAAIGLGGFTFLYARGASYLSDDPRACANCHVMHEQFDGWTRSSHRQVAVCNDCHTPAPILAKYWTKALNGYHHSYAFTTGEFHQPIMIKAANRDVTEQRCRSCHSAVVDVIDRFHAPGRALECARCHADVGHLH